MDDLVTWLRAQLDEDERVARAATPGPWAIWRDLDFQGFFTVGDEAGVVPDGEFITKGECNPTAHVYVEEDAHFVVAHNPARVLAEVEAKRALIEETIRPFLGNEQTTGRVALVALRLLAWPYADRPGYREEWRP